MKIAQYLHIKPGITALIGAGGKTTLMYKLAQELSASGTVIVCTSTKIMEPKEMPVLAGGSAEELVTALRGRRVICAGTRVGSEKLSAPIIGFEELGTLADYVIVEADGAHGLPLKAHADYEPVIPDGTTNTILVMGADAFGQPVSRICHRPERFAHIAGVEASSIVTPEVVKRVITTEGCGDRLFINKVEEEQAAALARELAAMLDMPVTAGSLKKEEYLCLR